MDCVILSKQMAPTFVHPGFEKYSFDEIPADEEMFLMDEVWLDEYEEYLVSRFEGGGFKSIGYSSYAAKRSSTESAIELSWYPNTNTRFHEVVVSLPREMFVACVSCARFDDTLRVFVRSPWHKNLYLRAHSIFALVDAIGVKGALKRNSLTREKLVGLRNRIDVVAKEHPTISFISFADSLLLKSNWSAGLHDSHIKYNYAPEIFIRLISEIQSIYRDVLGLDIYAVLTQGSNEYYDDPLLHVSDTKNHISLNSLGLPFAQLKAIEEAARAAFKKGEHRAAELYMDANLFHSLNFVLGFQRDSCGTHAYRAPLTDVDGLYYFANCKEMLLAVEP
jgi:hypothetical protein